MVADLCVIVVNWRDETRTLRCISAIREWNALEPTLLVVDNQSTSTSRKTLGAVLGPNELVFSETNLGYAGGNNLGIERALRSTASFFLLLNSDAAIEEEGVMSLLDRMRHHPEIAVIGPVLHEEQQGIAQSYAGGNDILHGALTRRPIKPETASNIPGYPLCDVDYVPGAVSLVRRSLFEQVGLLDEDFFFSGEIADLCLRARGRGHRVCVDLAAEAHHDIGEARNLRDTLYVYYSMRNRLLYAKKHHRAERGRYLAHWLGLCLAELGKALAQGKVFKARAILLAVVHGCTNRFGNQNASFL